MAEERRIKLIWDFHGPDALKTAEHHEVHLKEFAEREGFNTEAGVERVTDMHAIAFIVVNESDMIPVRDALIPHRGVLA